MLGIYTVPNIVLELLARQSVWQESRQQVTALEARDNGRVYFFMVVDKTIKKYSHQGQIMRSEAEKF